MDFLLNRPELLVGLAVLVSYLFNAYRQAKEAQAEAEAEAERQRNRGEVETVTDEYDLENDPTIFRDPPRGMPPVMPSAPQSAMPPPLMRTAAPAAPPPLASAPLSEGEREMERQRQIMSRLRDARAARAATSGGVKPLRAADKKALVAAKRGDAARTSVPFDVRGRLLQKHELRKAIVLREILGKPVGLR